MTPLGTSIVSSSLLCTLYIRELAERECEVDRSDSAPRVEISSLSLEKLGGEREVSPPSSGRINKRNGDGPRGDVAGADGVAAEKISYYN